MKRSNITFLTLFFLIPLFSIGQSDSSKQMDWVGLLNQPGTNFYDIQDAFEDHWQGTTGPGWKQFKRWENFMEPRAFPTGDEFQPTKTWEVVQQRKTRNVGRSHNGNWSYTGADDVPTFGGAGRINAVAFHPGNSNTILAGAASGGIWKTTDGGTTWNTTTDDLPVLGITDIIYDPSNTNTIYAATGDGDSWDTYSVGVIKSTDGGSTWDTTGLSFSTAQGEVINSLLINPFNTSILLAASSDGIYKTTDGGDNWTQVQSGNFKDLEFKPGTPSVVYASEFGLFGGGGKFYRSTDNGDNFSPVYSGTPVSGDVDRIEIAVTPADPSYVYFIAGNADDRNFHGLYRSTNSGQDFTEMSTTPNLLDYSTDGSGTSGQSYYDLSIAVSPNNEDMVFTGGINVWRSLDGGSSWDCQTHWYGANGVPYIHADIHELAFDANGNLYAGNDGGLFITTDNGASWSDMSDGLHIGQVYRIGTSVTTPDRIISGWQDNGTNLNAFSSWSTVIGGDGMECIIDHSDSDVMYGSVYYGDIRKSTDGGNSFSQIVGTSGTGVDGQGDWVTPYVMNPNSASELLVAKSEVYKSIDGGFSWNSLGSLSGASGDMEALAMAPSNSNYIYVSSGNSIWVSSDGFSFTDRSSGIGSFNSITYIDVDDTDPKKAWITLSGYSSSGKVYKTTDAGQTWTDISTGLPSIPVNCIVHEPGTNDGLYAGTDVGVYYRDSLTGSWQLFSDGLPNVIVNELEIKTSTDKIVAATYGRGIWESDLKGVATSITPSSASLPSMKIYPNPTKGTSILELSKSTELPLTITMKDPLGRTVKQFKGSNTQVRYKIDITEQEKGTYFLHTRIGNREFVEKMVVVE